MHLVGGGEGGHCLWRVTYPGGRKDHFPHKSLIALNLFRALSSFVSQHPVPAISMEAAPVGAVLNE